MREATICAVIMCGKPAGDGIICRGCLGKLEKMLAEVPWLIDQLDLAITKQVRFVASGGKVSVKGQSAPLMLNLQASDLRADLAIKLASWTSDMARSKSITAVAVHNPTLAAAWLLRHLEDVRVFIAAGDLVEEISAARAAAMYVVDRPAEKRYLGECGFEFDRDGEKIRCTETLWGFDRDSETVCRTCGAEWSTGERIVAIRDRAVTGMNDRIMTAGQAAETMVAYGIGTEDNATKLRDRIRKWAEQPKNPLKRPMLVKRLDLPIPGQRSRPGYRLGDIIDIVNRIEARRAA